MTARMIMKLDVVERRDISDKVALITFRHPIRPALPEWQGGAHVDVRLPNGKTRQYSLCGDPAEREIYRIAVKREDDGRGGSTWIHDNLKPGAVAHVSAPRTNFSLASNGFHLFVAGGIGVTPLVPMVREVLARGEDFAVHFCARERAGAPLLGELEALCGPRLTVHISGESRFDAAAALAAIEGDARHVYACGPSRLTDAVRESAAAAGWHEENVHFEVFRPTLDENFKPEPFDLTIARTGQTFRVPADRSALDVLLDAGFLLPSSCELGVCGSCVCGYTEGEVIHRDSMLGVADRQWKMAPCVSRARVKVTLDL